MEIIDKAAFYARMEEMLGEIKAGKIFVYPTDTIYGIGCNALLDESVLEIRKIKNREEKPFSVIAPSVDWIRKNCSTEMANNWIAKLPGKVTLVLKLKNKEAVSKEVNKGLETIGVRIPDNWFSQVIGQTGVPFVTTSVNITSQKFMTSLKDINKEIMANVDYIIDEGILNGTPSTVISLIEGENILR